ncbi:MAG: M3 family peptidase [Alphaproteobacteria bacterium]|nr:M3 family peptidase [Alphaproteobacteria bacterium]
MAKTPETPADLTGNPLINPPEAPHGAPPLDSVKPEHFLPAQAYALTKARQQIEDIKANRAAPSFENTIVALELSGQLAGRVMNLFGNILGANGNDALRAIEDDLELAAVKFGNDISLDEDLFKRVKAVYDQKDKLNLTTEQQTLLDRTYKGFVRNGANLDDTAKTELRDINEKLAKLYTAFEKNVVKSTAEYKKVIDNEDDLKGLPGRVKAMYAHFAEEEGLQGKWLIKLSPPPIDIFEYAENRELREEIYRARTNVAAGGDQYDNHQNVLDMVALRQRKAELMGFDNFAAYILDDRMAKTPDAVMDFLQKNQDVYRPAAEEYLDKVKDYAEKNDGVKDFQSWDFMYYSRKLKEETFQMSMEEVRPYFDLEKVLEGLRQHAEKLFNIELTETKDKYPVYHEDVKVYEVKDKQSGEMIGLFYADYYARAGAKNNGAWMNTMRKRGLTDEGENEFSIVTNVCNFPKPTKDHPTLLSLDDVRTVFHEFGHGLHALLAEGNYRSLTCTSVKRDFVELPSQLQENWVREKEVLDTFAKHKDTGAPIPDELIQKIQDMENFDAGYRGLRQTFFGLLDMKWHTTDPATIKSVEDFEDAVIDETGVPARVAGPQTTAFGHLFAGEGYSAGYYGYKWAEALDADVFSEFEKKGLYDKESADRLRETIYSKGGTQDPMELFKAMMGREPDPAALFRREGLLKEDKKPANTNDARPSGKKPPKSGNS